MTGRQIAKQTGLPLDSVAPILERLMQLHYVSHKGGRYIAEARSRLS